MLKKKQAVSGDRTRMLLAEEVHEDKNVQIDILDVYMAKNRYHQTID